MATWAEVKEIVKFVGAGFPDVSLPAETFAVWADRLSEYPPDVLLEAARRAIDGEQQYFPRIGRVKQIAEEIWTHRKSLDASKRLRLDEGRDPPNDPRVRAEIDKLREALKMPPARRGESES